MCTPALREPTLWWAVVSIVRGCGRAVGDCLMFLNPTGAGSGAGERTEILAGGGGGTGGRGCVSAL